MPKGTIGNFFFERGDDASPTAYTRLCPVFSMTGVGKTNALEDVTTFCSEGDREYIGGLADGKSVTIQANYPGDDDDGVEDLIADVEAKRTGPYRIVDENVTPSRYIAMDMAAIDWEIAPSVDSKNVASFEFKISGAITRGTL